MTGVAWFVISAILLVMGIAAAETLPRRAWWQFPAAFLLGVFTAAIGLTSVGLMAAGVLGLLLKVLP